MGGFFDGIVLHQILQWHHVVSERVARDSLGGLAVNTFVDGLFHQVMWLVTSAGVFLLYAQFARHQRPARRTLVGATLIGWGAFNVIDQIVFHVLFELHHIRPGPDYLVYDLAFTAWGLAMIAVGWALLRPRPTAMRPEGG